MFNTKKFLPAIALVAALTFAFGGEAKAQYGHGWGHGHGHSGHVYQPVAPSHWGTDIKRTTPNFGWRQPTYHNTTHLDYHAPQISRHGNHFHVQPGHYDVHRSGHWDH